MLEPSCSYCTVTWERFLLLYLPVAVLGRISVHFCRVLRPAAWLSQLHGCRRQAPKKIELFKSEALSSFCLINASSFETVSMTENTRLRQNFSALRYENTNFFVHGISILPVSIFVYFLNAVSLCSKSEMIRSDSLVLVCFRSTVSFRCSTKWALSGHLFHLLLRRFCYLTTLFARIKIFL